MGQQIAGLTDYANVPKTIATFSHQMLADRTGTTLGVEDLWWWLEINTVDNYNQMVINRAQENG
jgi:hypothetical protein